MSFAGLLLQLRGRTGLTQRDLAGRLGASRRSLQDWESGIYYPSANNLKALITVLLDAGGMTAGQEIVEAEALWVAALHEAERMRTPFDAAWFAELLGDRTTAVSPEETPVPAQPPIVAGLSVAEMRREHWGDAPDVLRFLGRTGELEKLQQWLVVERTRLVAVLGMGGIGKTMVVARLALDVASTFERVYWRSMRNAPPLIDWLGGAIAFLSDQSPMPPEGEAQRIDLLLKLLGERRCLLVLDNFETLLEPGRHDGGYRGGYPGYGQLLHAVGTARHRSCLVLTSREAPSELAALTGGHAVRELDLGGLGVAESRGLLEHMQLAGDESEWTALVDQCGGNGLALKIAGESIRQIFGGDMGAFFEQAGSGIVFGGIKRLLDEHIQRSSPLERDIMTRLAIEREPVSLEELLANVGQPSRRGETLEAIEALRHRSLVERANVGAAFTLQSVVLEYMTDLLVEQVAAEIEHGQPVQVVQHPLTRALAKDYVRRSQEHFICRPVVERLRVDEGASLAGRSLLALLNLWRNQPWPDQGCGPGNVVNLLRILRGDLRGLDVSGLFIRHAYLQDVEAQDASIIGAHLRESVLPDTFNSPLVVALSTDRTHLAAGTTTGELYLWRIEDRTLVLSVSGHAAAVWGLALSPDGRMLASGSVDGSIKLWDTESGQLLATLQEHSRGVQAVALSGDGQLLASCDVDATVSLWDVPARRRLATLMGHTGTVCSVALSVDGQLLASAGADGTVRLWDVTTRTSLATLLGHSGTVWCVALSPAARLVASSGQDGTVRLWDAARARALATLEGHTGMVCAVALSADGRFAVSGGEDGAVRVWELPGGRLLPALDGHTDMILSVALSADGELLASAASDGTVRLWEPLSSRPLTTFRGHASSVRSVDLTTDGHLAAAGGEDGILRLWNTSTGRLLASLGGPGAGIYSVALGGSGRLVVSGSRDGGTIRIWEVSDARLLATLPAHDSGVYCVALSTDEHCVASGGSDGLVKLWDVEAGELLATLSGHTRGVYGVAFSGGGDLLASASFDGTVGLWDTRRGRLLTLLEGHTAGVRSVAVTPDGQLVASASFDGTVKLWEAPGGRSLATLEGHRTPVYGVALSADGRVVASGSSDGTVKLWEAAGGRELATLRGHTAGVLDVALSGDGQIVASGSHDGTVRIWDAVGAQLHTLRPDRRYERMDITGLTGVTPAQRQALLALGAVEMRP